MRRWFYVCLSGCILTMLVIWTAATPQQCTTPPPLTGASVWRPGTNVVVRLEPNTFSTAEINALHTAFDNWSAANGANNSGVTFSCCFTGPPPSPSETDIHYVHKAPAESGVGLTGMSQNAASGSNTSVATTRFRENINWTEFDPQALYLI